MKKTIRNLIDYLYLYLENKRISKQLENKNLKWISKYNNKNKYIHAFFDLSNSRSTYDIVGYLIYLSSYSKIKNKEVKLIILPDEKYKQDWQKEKNFLTDESINFRNQYITKQLLNLVENFSPQLIFLEKREEALEYFSVQPDLKFPKNINQNELIAWDDYYLFINEFYKKNNFITSMKAPNFINKFVERLFNNVDTKKGIVTITIRDSSYSEFRNSNLNNWIEFYFWLIERDYYPIILNDTEKLHINSYILDKNNKRIPTFDLGSLNCDIRLGLYEAAFLNTGVGTGPTLLLNFSKYCNYLLFKTYVDEESSASLKSFEKICGFGKNEQWPFANNFQKLVWEKGDDFNLLKKEFINIERIIKNNV